MAIRRPIGQLPTDDAAMPKLGMPGAAGGLPAMPGIGGPSNNPGTPGGPGPQDGMSGMPMAPPPLQPQGGGPTSPLNIGSMLDPAQQMPGAPGGGGGAPERTPLPPWGDSQGAPGVHGAPPDGLPGGATHSTGYGDVDAGAPDHQGTPQPAAGAGGMSHAGSPSLVMVRLLKALGQI